MRITVNGEAVDLAERPTLTALLEQLGYVDGPVAVERNQQIVKRRDHADTLIEPGDVLEIVHFVGGG